ncbi:MAG: Integral membrane protein-like protein [Candidatus Gottesmanbacteria bacterium GW2011_GWA2_44_17]|uniref:Integral membrane protein-like protein n=1 Tax=Candidatus Gottesmanbacteria bacterium GW2011_GWA2_44_17 TaxID=1618444 RepID=A0A0G1KFM4_9BACT|nr:MAG: Integral membrane protein-like protein [Candidatus Gottesmanbacteria bacterium GW2011_GWA2_44_17]
MIKAKAILILTIVTLGLMLWQARLPLWNQHLQVDIWVWWQRLEFWFRGHTFSGLTGNEILPLTLLYLFIPVLLIPIGWLSYANYLPVVLILNLAVIGLHLFFVKRKTLFLLSLLFLGPILLFRFDALVTLLLILSFVSFQKNRPGWSGFWLGLATGLKVFPVIILPYLLLILFKQKQLKSLLTLMIYFAEALLLPVLIFWLLGGNREQIVNALDFHNLKLISIESLPGSLITGWSLITRGAPPALLAGYGIWAVPGPAILFNRLWLLPIGLVLPFVKAGRLIWILTLVVALLNQLVYPIFYTTLIEEFYQKNQSYWIYYLLLLRNLGILAITFILFHSRLFHSRTGLLLTDKGNKH